MYIYDDIILVISGSEVRNHDVLAQEWFHDFLTRPNIRIRVKHQLHSYANIGQDCESTKYETIRKASFDINIS